MESLGFGKHLFYILFDILAISLIAVGVLFIINMNAIALDQTQKTENILLLPSGKSIIIQKT